MPNVLILGSFVVDVAFRTPRLPALGETLMGSLFALGPGGKGSNQAVAAARAGVTYRSRVSHDHATEGNVMVGAIPPEASVTILTKIADDTFGQIARGLWQKEGIDATLVRTSTTATGAAAILIDEPTGDNAIIVVPGACFTLTPAEVEAAASAIRSATIFLAQLELPLETVAAGLRTARAAGVPTILNPAPAPASLPDELIALADYLIPNETEAAILTGLPVESIQQAEQAADALLARGAKNVIITLGSRGSLLRTASGSTLIPAFNAGPVVETTGAGDAFCGAFAAALAEGRTATEAARFASAAAAISVTRAGTAPSMPQRAEIDALLARF